VPSSWNAHHSTAADTLAVDDWHPNNGSPGAKLHGTAGTAQVSRAGNVLLKQVTVSDQVDTALHGARDGDAVAGDG
jgi:hypothetical protein